MRSERTARQWGRDFVKNCYTDWEAWTTLLSCAREQNCPLLAENVNQQEADNLFFSRNQAGLPRYAHSERKAGVGAERNALLALLAEYVIHAYEEVIALGMDVEHPSETRREAVHREVYTTIEPLQRLIVGT